MQAIKANLIVVTPICIGLFIGTYILYTNKYYKFNIYYFSRSE